MSVNVLAYPPPVEEEIHGITVRDPYRWLEDRHLPETEQWITQQQERCESYFANCRNLDTIRLRVREYLDIEMIDQPAKVVGRYFYRRRDKGKEQASIYVRDTTAGVERILVDPSGYGSFAAVAIHRISRDGSMLAYELRHGGTDKRSIHFVDTSDGRILSDRIELGYPRGLTFTANGEGFFYCQELSANANEHRVNLHLFHESVADQTVFRLARTRESRLVLTADGTHLGAIWIERQDADFAADFWIAKLDRVESWRPVFLKKKLPFNPLLTHGRIFAICYEDTLNGKLIELSEDGDEIRTVIPEQDSAIRHLVIAGDKVFVCYLDDSVPYIRCWDLSGQPHKGIVIPTDGTIRLLPNHNEEDTLFYTYESYALPPVIFEYSPGDGRSEIWHSREPVINQKSFAIRQSTYLSKDGVEIPITLVGGDHVHPGHPGFVIMTSYGGFGIPSMPQFSALVTIMLEQGVVFALPHIRGGGEFGKTWHDAGRGRNRQASFDDFLAAAEWLCVEGITTPEKLGIFGGSNSGLLVGAAMTQRPELFRAVLCIAPLLDMVRYETFDQAAKWRYEYGTAREARDFHSLYAYSPYHHVDDGVDYPPTLFVSGDKDDRCNPAHLRKMAARLLGRSAQTNAIVVDYSDQRGHSPVLPLSVRTEALARRVAFLCHELGICPKEVLHETTCT